MRVSLHAGRGGQGGYALLALLATSAILLAGLALSLPRMAMQAMRVKEERLIERGEQYRRAIELYYREHGKYPPELDDLEDTDGVRYLRRRYKEPMGTTGEWRIIHMGTDGRFEDSLLHDLGEPEGTGPRALFGDGAGGPAGTMIAERQGMEDRAGAGPPGYPGPGPGMEPLAFGSAERLRAGRQSAAPDLATRQAYTQGFEFNAGQAEDPQRAGTEGDGRRPVGDRMPSDPGLADSGDPRRNRPFGTLSQPGAFGRPLGEPPGQNSAFQRPGSQPARGPAGRSGQPPGNPAQLAAGSGAAQMINRLLTTPRAGGPPGLQGAQAPPQAASFERGIAGVASTREEPGVKVYGGKSRYNEWEFVFDYRKDSEAGRTNAQTQPQATQPAGQGGSGFGLQGRGRRQTPTAGARNRR